MNSLSELRNLVNGHHYVIRQSSNHDLIRDSIEELKNIKCHISGAFVKANTKELQDTIETCIDEGREKIGFHAYDAAEIFDDDSHMPGISGTILIYLFVLFVIAIYVSAINSSLNSMKFNKN
jgi:hypothetical protein